MAKKRFHSTTLGLNAEVIVAADVATVVTPALTYEAFVADDANEGAIGIFNADTKIIQIAALAEGDRYFFAQKRDGGTKTSSVLTYNKRTVKRIAYTAPVKQIATVTFAAGFVPARDEEVVVTVIETTPGNQPFPRWSYSVQAKQGETKAALLARLVALINDPTSVINSDMGPAVTASLAGDVLTLTAIYEGSSFRVALQEKAFDVASAVITTAFKQGSGYYDHVASAELAGNIFEGNTTQYPNQNATDAEFGAPTKFAKSGVTYDTFQIDSVRTEYSPTPVDQHQHYHHFILCVPVGATKSGAVGTALGFV